MKALKPLKGFVAAFRAVISVPVPSGPELRECQQALNVAHVGSPTISMDVEAPGPCVDAHFKLTRGTSVQVIVDVAEDGTRVIRGLEAK